MTDSPFVNKVEQRTPEQVVADVETAFRQPWGLRPPSREIISPEEYRRRYFNQETPK